MYKLPWPRLRWLFVLILIAGVRLSAAPPLPVDPPEAGTEIDFPLPGKYDAREVCPGVLFHSYVYEDFFGKPQVVSILEISLARRDLFMALRRCTDSRMTPEQFAREYRATAVLNCGFFNFKDNSPSFGFMLAGKVIGQFRPSPGSGVALGPSVTLSKSPSSLPAQTKAARMMTISVPSALFGALAGRRRRLCAIICLLKNANSGNPVRSSPFSFVYAAGGVAGTAVLYPLRLTLMTRRSIPTVTPARPSKTPSKYAPIASVTSSSTLAGRPPSR